MAIDEGRIAAIGPSDEIEARYPDADRVDGRGRAVFPGMINCHTHMLATVDRGILEDFGFPTTLRFPTTGRGLLDPEERNVFGLLAAAESIRSGGTTLLEISDRIPQYADSLAGTGLQLFLAENFNDIDDEQFGAGRSVRANLYQFNLKSNRRASPVEAYSSTVAYRPLPRKKGNFPQALYSHR